MNPKTTTISSKKNLIMFKEDTKLMIEVILAIPAIIIIFITILMVFLTLIAPIFPEGEMYIKNIMLERLCIITISIFIGILCIIWIYNLNKILCKIERWIKAHRRKRKAAKISPSTTPR